MSAFNASLHAYVRILIFVVIFIGIFITRNIYFLVSGYLIVLIFLIAAGQIFLHTKFFIIGNLPFLVILVLIYGVILTDNSVQDGNNYILKGLVIFLRVTILTSLFQLTFNVPAGQLLAFLKKLGIKGNLLIITVSSFAVWTDFTIKADKIITARLSRGHLRKRNLVNKVRQIPFVIKPLFVTTLLLALDRTASWKQRNFLSEIRNLSIPSEKLSINSILLNIAVILIVTVWIILLLLNKY